MYTKEEFDALMSPPETRVDKPTYKATMTAVEYVKHTRSHCDADTNAGFDDAELEQVIRIAAGKGKSTNVEIVREAAQLAALIVSERSVVNAKGEPAPHRQDPRHPEFVVDDSPEFGSMTPYEKVRRGRP